MKGFFKSLLLRRPADLLTIAFLLFLDALTVIFRNAIPEAPLLLGLYSSLVLVQIVLMNIGDRNALCGFFHDLFFPVACVIVIFDSLGLIVHYVNPHDIDGTLILIDYMIFGNHPTLMLEKIMHPVLTDILQIAYCTYYFFPLGLGIILLRRGRRGIFEYSLFMILLCYYLSYLGYILFPALGPRFVLDHLQAVELKGFLVAGPIQDLLDRLEGIKRDAFPSGHTAITLVVLWLAYKFEKKYFKIILPAATALIFSTVYCRYHYVVDVIAGFVLAVLAIVLGNACYLFSLSARAKREEVTEEL